MTELTTRQQVDKIIANLTHDLLMSRDEDRSTVLRESLIQYTEIQQRLKLHDEMIEDMQQINADTLAIQEIINDIRSMI